MQLILQLILVHLFLPIKRVMAQTADREPQGMVLSARVMADLVIAVIHIQLLMAQRQNQLT